MPWQEHSRMPCSGACRAAAHGRALVAIRLLLAQGDVQQSGAKAAILPLMTLTFV